MDKTFEYTYRVCSLITTAVFLLSVSGAYSQTTQSIESLANVSSWIDKESAKKMKAIAEWQVVKARHDATVAQRDSLKEEKRKCEDTRNKLTSRQEGLQRNLSALFSGGKGNKENKMFSQCDTTILSFHQGLYGDSVLDNKQKALLACLRAEQVLSVPYDKEAVDKSLETLDLAKTHFPNESAQLYHRIQQYGAMTENLRQALTVAVNTLDKFELDKDPAVATIKMCTEKSINKLGEELNPILLDPNGYPYLYDILTKAIATIMEDPRKSIVEQIDKL